MYWWLLDGQIVANITKSYFNYFTGEWTYSNLPPLINWKDILVPTINESSFTNPDTGIFNTVIAPVREMIGDTLIVKVKYTHSITSKEKKSKFFEIIGSKEFTDSVKILLK